MVLRNEYSQESYVVVDIVGYESGMRMPHRGGGIISMIRNWSELLLL